MIKVKFIKNHDIGFKEGQITSLHLPSVQKLYSTGYIEILDKDLQKQFITEIPETKKCNNCEDKGTDCEDCRKKAVKTKKSKP